MLTAADIGQALNGRRHGDGWRAACPVPGHGRGRGDKNPSLSIDDGANGSPVVRCHAGCAQEDVLDALRQRGLWEKPPKASFFRARHKGASKPKLAESTIIMPVPDDTPAPDFAAILKAEPNEFWDYRDADGRLLGYVVRIDKPDG